MEQTYFIKKRVDWSVLNQGFSIPVTLQKRVFSIVNRSINRGDKFKIEILYGSRLFQVDLINQIFDEKKYLNHVDVLQIRYNPNSELCKMLRTVFSATYELMLIEKLKKL